MKEKVTEENLQKHCLAVGAIMKGLANEINQQNKSTSEGRLSEELWEVCGLLHDLDFEQTKDNPKQHSIKTTEMLSGKLDETSLHAIRAHNFEHTCVLPESKLDLALISADAVSGLAIATAILRPTNFEGMTPKSLKKSFKKKDFARACSRENIMYCEKLGLDRGKFFEVTIESLKTIAGELGL
jgi:uncharacterized protein